MNNKKTVSIMQPTYIPWLGYFALMIRSDVFVLFDDVQFARRSWQQRNRIKTADGIQILTIPVQKKGMVNQNIIDVKTDRSSNYIKKHIGTLERSYSKASYYKVYKDEIFSIIENNYEYLSELTINLILKLKEILCIETKIIRSSELKVGGKSAEYLANICKLLNADIYISPDGSKGYLDKSSDFINHNILVKYNEYKHPEYKQLYGDFIPFLSVVDLIFNEGPRSLEIIRKGISE